MYSECFVYKKSSSHLYKIFSLSYQSITSKKSCLKWNLEGEWLYQNIKLFSWTHWLPSVVLLSMSSPTLVQLITVSARGIVNQNNAMSQKPGVSELLKVRMEFSADLLVWVAALNRKCLWKRVLHYQKQTTTAL